MRPVIIEAALNGPWSQAKQPLMPITPEALISEGIACARAGASVIHLHVYDPNTQRQFEDFEAYSTVIRAIHAETGAIVYPTLPLSGSADSPTLLTPQARFAVVEQLAQAGMLEWTVIDPGSALFADFTDIARDNPGFLYHNSEADIRHGLNLAAQHQIHPSFAIYEPGFTRFGAALADRFPTCPRPIYRFMFSEGFAFGFPPKDYALTAHIQLLHAIDPNALWMAAGLQVDIRPLLPQVLQSGGHIRVGLEDAPFGTQMTNAEWVEDIAQQITTAGYDIASPLQARTLTITT